MSRRLTAASVLATFVAVCAGWLDLALVLFVVATLWALCDLVMVEREQVARHTRSVR